VNIPKKLILLALLPLSINQIYAWGGWDDIKRDVKKAGHGVKEAGETVGKGVKDAGEAVGKGIHALYDATTSFYVTYKPVAGYPIGIQDLSILFLYPSGKTATADLIKDGAGQTQLISRVSSGGGSSLFSSGTSITTVELYFSMNITGSQLAVSTQEQISTYQSNTNSIMALATNNSTYSGNGNSTSNSTTQSMNIGSALIPLTKAPKGTPNFYKVIINGKTTSKTPITRPWYIEPQN
jgi:hypothetical protein